MSSCLKLILCFWFTALLTTGQEIPQPIVVTKYGKLKGKQLKVKETDRRVEAYLGVPFAKPPVGPLRFSPPKPSEPWDGVRDATSYPPWCLQNLKTFIGLPHVLKKENYSRSLSEDCLYLNVYAPALANKNARLPVMVWIHGGGLMVGDASTYDGSVLAACENVVVVILQYRLGIMGFLSTGDEHARGNWGFLDQVAALQWVQENIEHFGGDPDSVTIFGESAGGTSASVLGLSPLAKGLFHKAICQSGAALLPILLVTDPEEPVALAHMVANVSGCEASSAALVECLRKKTEEEMLNISLSMNDIWIPAVVDGIFLQKSPRELLANKECNLVPYIFGLVNHEMGWMVPSEMNFPGFAIGMTRKTITETLQRLLGMIKASSFKAIDLMLDEYLGDTEDPVKLRDLFLEMMGDMVMAVPIIETARYHRDAGFPVYMYEFQHRPSSWANSRPDFVKADHTDDISFVFGGPFLDSDVSVLANATDEEKSLSRAVMKYWANFARHGNPNGNGLVEWPVYDLSQQYLEIDLKQKRGTKLKDYQVTFWTKILPDEINEQGEHAEL